MKNFVLYMHFFPAGRQALVTPQLHSRNTTSSEPSSGGLRQNYDFVLYMYSRDVSLTAHVYLVGNKDPIHYM